MMIQVIHLTSGQIYKGVFLRFPTPDKSDNRKNPINVIAINNFKGSSLEKAKKETF